MWNFRTLNLLTISIAIQQNQFLLTFAQRYVLPRDVKPIRRGTSHIDVTVGDWFGDLPLHKASLRGQSSQIPTRDPTLSTVCKAVKERWGNNAPSESIFKIACDKELGGSGLNAVRLSSRSLPIKNANEEQDPAAIIVPELESSGQKLQSRWKGGMG